MRDENKKDITANDMIRNKISQAVIVGVVVRLRLTKTDNLENNVRNIRRTRVGRMIIGLLIRVLNDSTKRDKNLFFIFLPK
tara:strand:+ start:2106 stop:2348 length:243 start_codon:yes stop_codon:yes gene_type:complete